MRRTVLSILFIFLAMQATFSPTNAKVFQRCELARVLVNQCKYSRTMITNWLCMIEAESGMNSQKVAPYPPIHGANYPVYQSYGLFQINDKRYCGKGFLGGLCKIRCEDLLSDNMNNIMKAAQCAQIVLNTEGFKAWKGWETRCKPNQNKLPSVNDCFRTRLFG